ncbi:hypothetical protein HF086_017187 [Spodoptera exigua]|uniref:CHK kinase-like domain-containing protein n=1 Tax=Spodoptera exigua TaxID=7107 RepID=A0A922ME29_SPOEX|nr:hypothetical protein HF086_017187 [Spodoptera exigua]
MIHHNFEGDISNVNDRQLEFIKNVIDDLGFKDSKVTFEAVGAAGDNYAATVKRVIVEGENGKLRMIAKIAPANENMRLRLNAPLTFGNEQIMYQQFLPKLTQLQKQANIPEEEILKFPKCYGSNIEAPNEVILLEDLKEKGFVMMDRLKCLSEECVTSVLKNLAVLHSLSYVLKNKEPETFNYFKANLQNLWATLANAPPEELASLESIEEIYMNLMDNEEYKNLIRHKVRDIGPLNVKMSALEAGSKYAVIHHGDAWTTNFMFKYRGEELEQSILIDYQLSKISSPASDLLYMIFNCTDIESRRKNFHNWLDYYHSELDKSLSNHGLKASYVYSRELLDADLKRYGKLGFGSCLLVSSIMTANSEEAAKFKDFFESDTERRTDGFYEIHDSTAGLLKKRITGLIDDFYTFGLL